MFVTFFQKNNVSIQIFPGFNLGKIMIPSRSDHDMDTPKNEVKVFRKLTQIFNKVVFEYIAD